MRVVSLQIYPVKSFGAFSLNRTHVTTRGLSGDRRWMVVDSQGRFVTQRAEPSMAMFHCRIERGTVLVSVENDTLHLPTSPVGTPRTVSIWGSIVVALEYAAGSAWVSRHLGSDCRLVYMPDHCRRPIDPAFSMPSDHVSFADGFPVLITTVASLDALSTAYGRPLTMNRFRPNIVLDGVQAFAEDQMTSLTIGDVRFRIVKPCERCVMITACPTSGTRDPQVLRTLTRLNNHGGQPIFGANAIGDSIGEICVGDTVDVRFR